MTVELPFPGYSWPFTQHAVGLENETLYNILACAACYEGVISPGPLITELMIENRLLTANVRDGQADAWRDYQQILAELGLIYSTRIQKALTLTKAGKLFLAGELGFSELITGQALRYQYPNGQKATIQSRLRKELTDSNFACPDTLLELHVVNGVHLRPAVLVLRVLIEVLSATGQIGLSVDELMHCLMPIVKNSDWPQAVANIKNFRREPFEVPGMQLANRRNAQDWIRFLGKSDLFNAGDGFIQLSPFALDSISDVAVALPELEDVANTWIPLGFSQEDRKNWFDYYGTVAGTSVGFALEAASSEDYLQQNYLSGPSDYYTLQVGADYSSVNLTEHVYADPDQRNEDVEPNIDLVSAISNLKSGILKQKIKAALHDEIVDELARKCADKGGTVFVDPNSVDLLVKWPNEEESIFEVKTVTEKSCNSRLRAAVGQIQEYAYRRLQSTGVEPEKSIAIDFVLPETDWHLDFFHRYLDTGLVCRGAGEYLFYLPEGSSSSKFLCN